MAKLENKRQIASFALKKNMPISKSIIRKNIINFFCYTRQVKLNLVCLKQVFMSKNVCNLIILYLIIND